MNRIQNIIAFSLVSIFSVQAIIPDAKTTAYCISLHEYKLLCTKLDQWYAMIWKEIDQLEFGAASLKKRVGPYEVISSIEQSTKKLVVSLLQSKAVNAQAICEYIENSVQHLVAIIKDNMRCPVAGYKKVSIPQGVNAYYIEESAKKDILSACDKIRTIIKKIKSTTVCKNGMTSSLAQYKFIYEEIDNVYTILEKNIRAHFENYNRIITNIGTGQLISEQDIATIKSYNDAFDKTFTNLFERLKSKVINIDEVTHDLNQVVDHIRLTLSADVEVLGVLREGKPGKVCYIPCLKNEDVIDLLSVLRNQLEGMKTIVKVKD